MTIHEAEYYFFRELRRFRGKILKLYQKGTVTNAKIIRTLIFFLIVFSLFRLNLTTEARRDPPVANTAGLVLSSESVVTPSPSPIPIRIQSSPDMIGIIAQSALIIDASSSAILFEKDSSLKLSPASLTKIMTALISLERDHLTEIVTVGSECTKFQSGAQVMGLKEGEKISIRNLISGLLISSAADSACALSFFKESPEAFISRMRAKASLLGMTETEFKNVTGLDEANIGNQSTASDLLKLTREALKNDFFREIVATRKIVIRSEDGLVSHTLVNTNELLGSVPGVLGVKTGFTDKAGGCLIFDYTSQGREIIGVILKSTERGRFEDTLRLIDWIFRVYEWR